MNQPPTIAIVDDDEGVRLSLTSLLRSLGYDVRSYASAQEFLAADADDPACLIADVQMPHMTGDQLQAKLLESGRRFPIIFMTAFPTPGVRERVMAAGACAFLDKPTASNFLVQCLARALGHSAL